MDGNCLEENSEKCLKNRTRSLHEHYIHINYLLVKPKYQLKGVGKTLVEKVKQHYHDYQRIAVVTLERQSRFYEYCEFEKREDKVPLFITELED